MDNIMFNAVCLCSCEKHVFPTDGEEPPSPVFLSTPLISMIMTKTEADLSDVESNIGFQCQLLSAIRSHIASWIRPDCWVEQTLLFETCPGMPGHAQANLVGLPHRCEHCSSSRRSSFL